MDHSFCRTFLQVVMGDVRKVTTSDERKSAWTYRFSGCHDSVEFHGPGNYFWYGRACCAWAGRAYGWQAWLDNFRSESLAVLTAEINKTIKLTRHPVYKSVQFTYDKIYGYSWFAHSGLSILTTLPLASAHIVRFWKTLDGAKRHFLGKDKIYWK